MKSHRKMVVAITAGLLALPVISQASDLQKKLDVQAKGLTLVSAAAGGVNLGAGSRNLTVNIQGTVLFARLYWIGRQRPCDKDGGGNCAATFAPYRDQVMNFDGHQVTGAIIGTEGQPISSGGPIFNLTYFADVTNYVKAKGTGTQNFTFSDADLANNLWRLDGVGLLVGYTDPANLNTYRVIVWDGADFAYGKDPNSPVSSDTRTTDPVTVDHGINTAARSGQFTIFVGDTDANRPDRIDISNNPSVNNSLTSNDGPLMENETIPFNIPAGVGTTTIQLVSAPVTPSTNPDSMIWGLLALRVPQLDTTKPRCVLSATRTGPPAQIDITAQDVDSGMASIIVSKSYNANTPVPPFTSGDTSSIVITATKIDQTKPAQVELTVSDLAGNVTVCDPILALLVRDPGKQEVQTFTNVASEEHVLTVYNGKPGVAHIEIWVNDKKLKLKGLTDGETATFDLGSLMRAQGGNTVSAKVGGQAGSSVNIMLWDGQQ